MTPLQGPILLRNGSVPVVPLTSYRTVNNGSFYQIPVSTYIFCNYIHLLFLLSLENAITLTEEIQVKLKSYGGSSHPISPIIYPSRVLTELVFSLESRVL